MRAAHLLEPCQRAPGDGLAQRGLGHLRERACVAQRLDGGEADAFVHAFKGIERDIAQHRERVVAHALVGVVAPNRRERLWIEELRDRRPSDARVVVVARGGDDLIALRHRQFGKIREPDRRIRIFLWLGAKAIEQGHEMPSPVNRAATSLPCDAVRTCLSMSRMRPSAPI